MNTTSKTTLATADKMSPFMACRAAPSARTICSRQKAAANTGTNANITATYERVADTAAASAPSKVTNGCSSSNPAPPTTTPATTEPQTANDDTCLISPACPGSCSAAPN